MLVNVKVTGGLRFSLELDVKLIWLKHFSSSHICFSTRISQVAPLPLFNLLCSLMYSQNKNVNSWQLEKVHGEAQNEKLKWGR